MSRTTARTMALLGLLHSGRTWSAEELCERLEVSQRTLRRDIDDLRGLGYGIDATRGSGGGYRLGVGASLPPLVLTPDEAIAVGIGLRSAAATRISGLDEAATRALAKLQRSLASETRERIAVVSEALLPLGMGGRPVELNTVTTVARAIREQRRLAIDYTRGDGAQRRRTIEPLRIVPTRERWYVVAWDPDAERWRTLRLDRLVPRLPLGRRFDPKPVPDEEVRRFASWSISVAPYPVRTSVRMHAGVDHLRQFYGPESARLTDLGDGTTRVEAGAADLLTLREWLNAPGVDWEHLAGDAVPRA